ncbi:putative ABC transport system permease protein [Brevibacterium sanguinis]|uniref:ABC transport system permease protein n=2 Tax=Brevibacterium TaxID=1696 RepID=A0ABX9GNM2_9MICO|nr:MULTISPECIES: ABC transporter permease [Brevibacterium]RBP63438.1 putative ABC transport system permease protein [Brevibacterium sanguinis]RBP69905.1 putative ABC transport system permease protein [Brevibacterium celere]
MITGFLASIVEAWQELRVHKVRVLMSLIGVGVAVCALTLVVGFGDMMKKGLTDEFEKQGGRDTTYTFSILSQDGTVTESDAVRIRSALETTTERFGISYYSAYGQNEASLPGPTGTIDASMLVVDPSFDVMRRLEPDHGRWFTEADRENLSPPVVAETIVLDEYGIDPAQLPATIELPGPGSLKGTVIGAVESPAYAEFGSIYVLSEHASRFGSGITSPTDFEMWLPPESASELGAQVTNDLERQLPDADVESFRSDFAADMGESLGPVQNVLLVISVLILFMGMLGLLNISLVTIQQRIREIGIRRSFGATSARIFFSVMMESVVATTVAGAVGVLIAVLVLKAPFVLSVVFEGMSTPPQVPFIAVIVGLLVSIGVGALAGLVPAIVATRVRIIDAIRA